MIRGAAGVLAGLVLVCGGAVGCGDDDDDAGGSTTSTTMETGGIEVPAPDGWTKIPLPVLGFGIAVPPGWESVRLDAEGLSSISQADPVVPDFVAAAHNAYNNGSVFYAAGVDQQGRITDLKVGADIPGGDTAAVEDAAGLEAYAAELASALANPTVSAVEGAANPTVDIRFSSTASREADDGTTEDITVEGTQRLILSPAGIVYSLIITSEDPTTHDALANEILTSFTLGDGA